MDISNYSKININEYDLDQLFEMVTGLDEDDFKLVEKQEELGPSLHLAEAALYFREIRDLLIEISLQEIKKSSRLPKELQREFRILIPNIGNAALFNVEVENPSQKRTAIINEAKNLAEKIRDILTPTLFLKKSRQIDTTISHIEKTLDHQIKKNRDKIALYLKSIEDSEVAAKNAADAAREAAGTTAASAQSAHFQSEANTHKQNSYIWITALILLFIAFFVSLLIFDRTFFLFVDDFKSQITINPLAIYISTKILFFGGVLALILLFRRLYISSVHNRIVNQHRANALKTYDALAEAANSLEGREVVLQSAANCIFAHQDTGLGSAQSGSTPVENVPQFIFNPSSST